MSGSIATRSSPGTVGTRKLTGRTQSQTHLFGIPAASSVLSSRKSSDFRYCDSVYPRYRCSNKEHHKTPPEHLWNRPHIPGTRSAKACRPPAGKDRTTSTRATHPVLSTSRIQHRHVCRADARNTTPYARNPVADSRIADKTKNHTPAFICRLLSPYCNCRGQEAIQAIFQPWSDRTSDAGACSAIHRNRRFDDIPYKRPHTCSRRR